MNNTTSVNLRQEVEAWGRTLLYYLPLLCLIRRVTDVCFTCLGYTADHIGRSFAAL